MNYNKKIDKSKYGEIKISSSSPSDSKSGVVYLPYVLSEHTEQSRKEYDDFMTKYSKEHEVCPRCGETGHTVTLVGYALIGGEEDKYKDKNRCVCSKCNDKHIVHDRISVKEFEKQK